MVGTRTREETCAQPPAHDVDPPRFYTDSSHSCQSPMGRTAKVAHVTRTPPRTDGPRNPRAVRHRRRVGRAQVVAWRSHSGLRLPHGGRETGHPHEPVSHPHRQPPGKQPRHHANATEHQNDDGSPFGRGPNRVSGPGVKPSAVQIGCGR